MHVKYYGTMKVYWLNFPWAQGASLDGLGKYAVPSMSKYSVAVYNRGMAKA
jgi:formate-dependent nitrite reductase cytochrome c552 subunit